jgi:xanthine dehydrogenase accessory factor
MKESKHLSQIICQYLDSGLPVILISIVSAQGSVPRHRGSKMVVGADGKSYGTIGGSLLEATAIKESQNVLAQQKSGFLNFELTGENAYSSGMICGGRAVLLLEYVPATRENREFFNSWHDAFSGGKDLYLITGLKENADHVDIVGHCLLFPDGQINGTCHLAEQDIKNIREELHNISSAAVLTLNDGKALIENMRKLKTLYCFGAGHVALPTAQVAALVGFRVVVITTGNYLTNTGKFIVGSKSQIDKIFGNCTL